MDSEEDDDDDEEGSHQEEDDAIDKESWLYMNPAERKRQEKAVKENYKKENQTRYQATKEYFRRGTGSLLSRTLLPLLKPSTKEVPLPTAVTDEEIVEATDAEDLQQDDEDPSESSPTQKPVNDATNATVVVGVDVADAPTLEPAELSPTQSALEEASNVVDVADAPALEESPISSMQPVIAAI
jgi:hypothetical protein